MIIERPTREELSDEALGIVRWAASLPSTGLLYADNDWLGKIHLIKLLRSDYDYGEPLGLADAKALTDRLCATIGYDRNDNLSILRDKARKFFDTFTGRTNVSKLEKALELVEQVRADLGEDIDRDIEGALIASSTELIGTIELIVDLA